METNIPSNNADARAFAAPRLRGVDLVATLSAPSAVLIVGASTDANSYASKPLAFLKRYGYAGRMLAVNPHYPEVDGVPCLPSIAAVEPGSIDVAMVTLPAAKVAQALVELDAAGVRATITIAGGWDADGGAGRDALRTAVRGLRMRVIGPNCIGVVNTRSSTYLSFSREVGRGRPRRGSIALVTQSGAVGNAVLISLLRRGAGISHWITSGDELDTGSLELIAGLLHDDTVRAVGAFFEGMTDIAWLPAVRDAIRATGKPVYVLKGASTDAGRAAAAGHTGRVVGAAEVALAVMRDAGLTVVSTLAQLTDALIAVDVLRALRGPRIGIVSISGGFGVIGADAVRQSARLTMATLDDEPALQGLVGGRVSAVHNPVDVAGSPIPVFADWIKGFASAPGCDAVVAVNARMLNADETLADAMLMRSAGETMMLVPFTDAEAIQGDLAEKLAAHGIAVMPTVERAIAALDVMPMHPADALAGRAAPLSATPSGAVAGAGDAHSDAGLHGLEHAASLLPELPWSPFAVVDDLAGARGVAATWGFPLVIKLAGRTVQHRSEAGAVAINVTAATLTEQYTRIATIAHAHGDAVLVQQQVSGAAELMLSAMIDPELGPVVTVRPGGVFTELLAGTAVLWSGWDAAQRRAVLAASVAGTLLQGYRGGPHYDLDAVAQLVEQTLAALAAGRLAFLELNPVLVGTRGAWLVDALVR